MLNILGFQSEGMYRQILFSSKTHLQSRKTHPERAIVVFPLFQFVGRAPFVSKFSCGCSGATARAARCMTSHLQNRFPVIGGLFSSAPLAARAAAAAASWTGLRKWFNCYRYFGSMLAFQIHYSHRVALTTVLCLFCVMLTLRIR